MPPLFLALVLFVALALPTRYQPWWAQRMFIRSKAPIRVIVAGRQSGKTHSAAEEVVRIICSRPGTDSCLLMPTYKSTKGTLKHLRRALKPLGRRVRWKEVDKCFAFWNGAHLYVRTADDKEGVPTRGLTLDGVLWVDEASYVPRSAWDAAKITLGAVPDPLCIITTTARGKNWAYEEWISGQPGPKKSEITESFRFRTLDSPFASPKFIADIVKKMGRQMAMQELNAVFLGSDLMAFDPDDVARIFVHELPVRGQCMTLGVDLGKQKDWTVVTLMNEFGEAWVVGRWKRVKWPDQLARVVGLAERFGALVVVDEHKGGGYGGAMKDFLERELGEKRVLGVKTGQLKLWAEVVEILKQDVEGHRLRIRADLRGKILYHELLNYEQHTDDHGLTKFGAGDADLGATEIRVEGDLEEGETAEIENAPEVFDDDEADTDPHDDCVVSLGLANHGRLNGWAQFSDPLGGPLDAFVEDVEAIGRPAPGESHVSPASDPDDDTGGWGAVDGTGFSF